MKDIFLKIVFIFCGYHALGQDTIYYDYTNELMKYDISELIVSDSIQTGEYSNRIEQFERPEIIGYIGDNFQRFYIHFISIIKYPYNSNEYMVYGKTKVKSTICEFQGVLCVKSASICSVTEVPNIKQGQITFDVLLVEDPKQQSSGMISGKLISNFLIDTTGKLRYDAILAGADAYRNNQFNGFWRSYKSGKNKVCNWGDFRIPDSDSLDMGACCFSPRDEYLQYGWQTYRDAYFNVNEPGYEKAVKAENLEWW